MCLDYAKIRKDAQKDYARAKGGAIKVGGVTYHLRFLRPDGVYDVTGPNIDHPLRFNTRRLATAKQWLKDWLAN